MLLGLSGDRFSAQLNEIVPQRSLRRKYVLARLFIIITTFIRPRSIVSIAESFFVVFNLLSAILFII